MNRIRTAFLILAVLGAFIASISAVDSNNVCRSTLPAIPQQGTITATLVSEDIAPRDTCGISRSVTMGRWLTFMQTSYMSTVISACETSAKSTLYIAVYANCSTQSGCCQFCREFSTRFQPVLKNCEGSASVPVFFVPNITYYIYIGASDVLVPVSNLSVTIVSEEGTTPRLSSPGSAPHSSNQTFPHGIETWMFYVLVVGPIFAVLVVTAAMLACSCRPGSGVYLPMQQSSPAYVTPGNPASGPAVMYAVPEYTAYVDKSSSVPQPTGSADPIPWSNCSSFDSDCSQIVEYRCSGWFTTFNVFWALSICAWLASLYAYNTGKLPTDMGKVLLIVGGVSGYVGAFFMAIAALASWSNETDPKGCGFCGARVLSDREFARREMSKRVCNPMFLFCSTNPARCFGSVLFFRNFLIVILNLLVGAVGLLAVALSVLAIAGASGGGGGGNCNCNCGGDCCDCSSKKDEAAVENVAPGTSATPAAIGYQPPNV